MRLHITLDEAIVARLDQRVGPRGRSAFIAESVRQALDDESRWDGILGALGTIPDTDHEWDADPDEWVGRQRMGDPGRVG